MKRCLAAAVLSSLLVSCVGQPSPSPSPSQAPEAGIPLYPANPASDAAFLTAQLTLDGDCLYLVVHGDRWLAIWPSPGTSWNGVALSFRGQVIPSGAEANFLGGEGSLTADQVESYDFVNSPKEHCLVGNAWWVAHVDPAS